MNWLLLQNSLCVAAGAALLATVFGAAAAFFSLGLPRAFGKGAWLAALGALVVPPFLVTNSWLEYLGLAGSWRAWLDFNLYSLPGTIFLITLTLWPVPFFFAWASARQIDRAYLEQEPLLRGGAFLRHVLWPRGRRALALGGVVAFALALNNFTVPALLQTKVYAAEIWLSFNTKFDYAEALRLSWPLVLAPLGLLWLFRSKAVSWTERGVAIPFHLFRQRLGWCHPVLGWAAGLLWVLSAVPLVQLVSNTRTWTEFWPAIAAGRQAALHSILFGTIPALAVAVIGVLGARSRVLGWTWLAYLVPGITIGIGLVWLLNRPGLEFLSQTVVVVLLAFVVRFLALGWSAARAASGLVDSNLSDTVRVFGGNRWQQFWRAEWPQSRPVLLAGLALVYLFCLWEVEMLLLIVPPGGETLALRVFNMLHYGHAGQVNALCVWLLLLGVGPIGLLWLGGRIYRLGRLYSHYSRVGGSGLAGLFLTLAVAGLGLGCGGPEGSEGPAQPIRSQIFSSVQIIGSRGTGAGQFNKPRSLALDRDNNLYVADMTGRVQKFAPDGRFLLAWQMPQTDKGKPKGMVQDESGNIIVIEPHYSRVNHFTPAGELIHQWGAHGTNQGQLIFPRAVAINSQGGVFLSEYGLAERVQQFSARGSNWVRRIGSGGTEAGQFNRAEGLGIGPDDTLYVADSCNHRVQIFSPEGVWLGQFGRAGAQPGELSYPYDVRVDSTGHRFVCEFGNSRVQVFDAANQPVEWIGGAGHEPGRMNNPWSIALDPFGHLYVADSANHRVQKFIRRVPLAAPSQLTRSPGRTGAPPVPLGASPSEIPGGYITPEPAQVPSHLASRPTQDEGA